MTTPAPDPAAITAAARAYPWHDWHDELISDIALRALSGAPLLEAVAAAYRWADTERRNLRRGAVSLDELQAECGDALNFAPLPAPALAWEAFGTYGERQPQTGMTNPHEITLGDFTATLRNVFSRLGIDLDPFVAALDMRGFSGLYDALAWIMQGATKDELREAGIGAADLRAVRKWARAYVMP